MQTPTNPQKKGAMFFTVDTMVAGIIFTLTVVIVLSFYVSKPVIQDTNQALNNYINYISEVKMDRFRNLYIFVYNDINETDPQLSVYEKIAKLDYEGKRSIATGFIENFSKIIVPDQFGIAYYIDNTLIYQKNTGSEQYSKTNLTAKLLTFYIKDDRLIGPNITKITIWS